MPPTLARILDTIHNPDGSTPNGLLSIRSDPTTQGQFTIVGSSLALLFENGFIDLWLIPNTYRVAVSLDNSALYLETWVIPGPGTYTIAQVRQ